MRTFLLVWAVGWLGTLAANLYLTRKELRAWWPTGAWQQKAALTLIFPMLSLALWPLVVILMVGARGMLPLPEDDEGEQDR